MPNNGNKILFIDGKFVWDYTINAGIRGNPVFNAIQKSKTLALNDQRMNKNVRCHNCPDSADGSS